MSLPSAIYLTIPIYKGGDLFQVKARLRTRRQGTIMFYFIIDQVDRLKEVAFEKICNRVKEGNPSVEVGRFEGVGMEVLKGEVAIYKQGSSDLLRAPTLKKVKNHQSR